MNNIMDRKMHQHAKKLAFLLGGIILIIVASGCSLERDEHTVQYQQLQQPNETDDLPVWQDVYSKSVNHDVYSPQGNSEVLP